MSTFGDRGLLARAGIALVLANARFWPTVVPLVGRELRRWETAARRIENPALRALALEKLDGERFNAEVAATLATLAPSKYRQATIAAIVAYEVMYDYLDGLTEIPTENPLRDGHELYRAFTDAVEPRSAPLSSDYAPHPRSDDGGYLAELVSVVRQSLIQLPAADAVAEASQRAAGRCAEAQIRAHAVPRLGTEQLEHWALGEVAGSPLRWQQFLAGSASSVLAVHALIAAAADERTTARDASELDTVYLSICALSTMLDSLIDHEADLAAGQVGYSRYYESHDLLAEDLVASARRALEHTRVLRNGPHHAMTLVGVAAYYLSAPTAASSFVRPVAQRIETELQPLMTPTSTVMRTWRLAKRSRATIAGRAASDEHGPTAGRV